MALKRRPSRSRTEHVTLLCECRCCTKFFNSTEQSPFWKPSPTYWKFSPPAWSVSSMLGITFSSKLMVQPSMGADALHRIAKGTNGGQLRKPYNAAGILTDTAATIFQQFLLFIYKIYVCGIHELHCFQDDHILSKLFELRQILKNAKLLYLQCGSSANGDEKAFWTTSNRRKTCDWSLKQNSQKK